MILQNLLFPSAALGADQEMYFRTNGSYDEKAHSVSFKKGQTLTLAAYFNCFSIEKWMKYTVLTDLSVELSLKGRFCVLLMRVDLKDGQTAREVLSEQNVSGSVSLSLPAHADAEGLYAVSLAALEDGCEYLGGQYVTSADEASLRPVDIAIDICTFRREPFIERNLKLLNESIIENPLSAMHGHLDVFISDNGQTLDIGALSSDHIHIVRNRNVGGAGGFTRGMIEILNDQKNHPRTHVLVMDDDVLINPDALLRTYRILRMLKPEFYGKTVAGAMMRLDHKFIQHESGAFWNGKYTESAHTFLDMRKIENVISGEDETKDKVNFNAWWYSCIPIEKISLDNLPLPIFIRFDDVEYGLRTGSDILTLNGICLWHEPFEYKYSSSMDYYHMRNGLIINSFHRSDITGFKAALEMVHIVLSNLVRYRYSNIELILRAAEDFLKGAGYHLQVDAEALHKELMAASQKFLPPEQLSVPFEQAIYDECYRRFDAPLERVLRGETEIKAARSHAPKDVLLRIVRWVTMNGLLLPAKGQTYIVHPVMNHTSSFFRKSAVLNWDPIGKKGFVSERNVSKSFAMLFRAAVMALRLMFGHKKASESFRRNRETLTGIEFWKKYLGL